MEYLGYEPVESTVKVSPQTSLVYLLQSRGTISKSPEGFSDGYTSTYSITPITHISSTLEVLRVKQTQRLKTPTLQIFIILKLKTPTLQIFVILVLRECLYCTYKQFSKVNWEINYVFGYSTMFIKFLLRFFVYVYICSPYNFY